MHFARSASVSVPGAEPARGRPAPPEGTRRLHSARCRTSVMWYPESRSRSASGRGPRIPQNRASALALTPQRSGGCRSLSRSSPVCRYRPGTRHGVLDDRADFSLGSWGPEQQSRPRLPRRLVKRKGAIRPARGLVLSKQHGWMREKPRRDAPREHQGAEVRSLVSRVPAEPPWRVALVRTR